MKDQFPRVPTKAQVLQAGEPDWLSPAYLAREDKLVDELTVEVIREEGKRLNASTRETPSAIRQFYKRIFCKRMGLPELTDEQYEMVLGMMSLDPEFDV